MTVAPDTDWRSARRADKAAEREQDREDARMRAELERIERREREERKTREREEQREAQRREREERAAAAAKARQSRRAGRRRLVQTIRDQGDVAATLGVMACSMGPALYSQFMAIVGLGMGLFLGLLLPVMLELGTWAATAGEARALREGRRVWPYRIAVWACASFAASVNLANGSREFGPVGGVILAASSVVPVGLWHMVMTGRHSAKARKTKAERAAERKAQAEAKARAEHLKARRRHHRAEAALADQLISAAPFGTLDAEEAFRRACEILHGTATPGMTPALYALAAQSRARLGAAFDMDPGEPEQIRTTLLEGLYGPDKTPRLGLGKVLPLRKKTPQVAAQIPQESAAAAKGPQKRRPTPPKRRRGDTAPYHPAARVAARETALRSAAQ